MPALAHCEAVSRKPLLWVSTDENTLEKAAGSGVDGPRRKALVTEKSHASGFPLGPLGTHTSAGRREEEEGSGGSGSGGRSQSSGSRGIRRPGFFQDGTKPSLKVGCRVNHVTNHIVPYNPIPPAATHKRMVTPLVHDLSAKRAVCILVPDRHPKTTQDANPEEWGKGCVTRQSPEAQRARHPLLADD